MTKHKATHFNMESTELQKVQQNEELVPDGQKYQLCFQHLIGKTELKKIWQENIQDSSSLKTPVYSRLPYTYGDF